MQRVLQMDPMVKLHKILLTFSGEEETAIVLNLIVNGTVTCCVGFIPHDPKRSNLQWGNHASTEIYPKHSKKTAKCKKIHHNHGLHIVAIVSDLDCMCHQMS